MGKLSKKILSAFIEMPEDGSLDPGPGQGAGQTGATTGGSTPSAAESIQAKDRRADERQAGSNTPGGNDAPGGDHAPGSDHRFETYFDKLFSEANIPGPDYFEFSKMTDAMQSIADERARFYAAFAGLQVQGLDKQKLLSTAGEYLRVLEADAGHFKATIEQAMQEKVRGRVASVQEKNERIRSLTQEMSDLHSQVLALQVEIKENEEKIKASSGGYAAECENRRARMQADIEKIKQYIH